MLVLSRMVGERIFIGGPGLSEVIVVEVHRAQGGKARIGIQAPDELKIMREELVTDRVRTSVKLYDRKKPKRIKKEGGR